MSGYANFARYYDLLTRNIDYGKRAAYFSGIIRTYTPEASLLLDLGCGTGSLTLELAALGYDMIGADPSGEMLSEAMNKAAQREQRILFINQGGEDLDLYGTIDGCVCALDAVNHFPDEKTLGEAFGKVSLFLNPGGIFVFDVNTPYKHRQVLGNNTFVYDCGEVFCVWQNAYRAERDAVDMTLDFFENNGKGSYRRSTDSFTERIYEDSLLRQLLEEKGLELLQVYGEDSLAPPRTDCQRLVYVARKK